MAVKRCNYSYEKLNECMLGMMGRLADKGGYTMERAKNSVQDARLLFHILDDDKDLAKVLIQEGHEAMNRAKEKENV